MKKSVISVLLAAGMIAGALAGCGGASGGAAADSGAAEDLPYTGVTLTVWVMRLRVDPIKSILRSSSAESTHI